MCATIFFFLLFHSRRDYVGGRNRNDVDNGVFSNSSYWRRHLLASQYTKSMKSGQILGNKKIYSIILLSTTS